MGVRDFDRWTGERTLASVGTNSGSDSLAFQTWKTFKEAFAPEIVDRAIRESGIPVATVLDPFGGSGTTALACQFLGVKPITVEVNPFLADLIRAKLEIYDVEKVRKSAEAAIEVSAVLSGELEGRLLPETFVEPGKGERWIFSRDTFRELESLRRAIELEPDQSIRRLLRVLLGGTLVGLSNARVSGKGRRYRADWVNRQAVVGDPTAAFGKAVGRAAVDLEKFGVRSEMSHKVLLGDSREVIEECDQVDLIVFSPPYPNSFDYTDVYNIELWMLGYLDEWKSNKLLRHSTLGSHVQVARTWKDAPLGSVELSRCLSALKAKSNALWSRHIPAMIASYFSDMTDVLEACRTRLPVHGEVWMVVGDSRYSGETVRVATILEELSLSRGYTLVRSEPFRSMRSSPQQGGTESLSETLVVLRKL
jgi:hypothetical protein